MLIRRGDVDEFVKLRSVERFVLLREELKATRSRRC